MYSITAICNAGVGSSAFCRVLIQKAAQTLGYRTSDLQIRCMEIMGSKGLKCDLIVTQKMLYDRVCKNVKDGAATTPVVAVQSLVSNPDKMAEALAPYLEEAEKAGKVKKA